jgi:hypothetical protein
MQQLKNSKKKLSETIAAKQQQQWQQNPAEAEWCK